jgi:predicted HicB family RNase H-like nuclease
MMTKKIHRALRLEPILSRRCDDAASEKQLTFSEWIRQVLRREVGLKKK